jgi:hypothetical protein
MFSGRCLALAFTLAAYGCNGDGLTVPPNKGILEVSIATGGVELDADGYTVQVGGGTPEPIGTAATWTSGELDPGSYAVELGGLAANCSVAENPRTVIVTAGETTTVAFQVTCGVTTGSLEISTATNGTSPDADGYAVTLDGADRGAIQATGSLMLGSLSPGDHLVGLSGVAANCTVEGENPRTVLVAAGSNATTAFAITCTTPPADAGSLRITTTTQGPGQDPDGYAFTIDGGSGQPIGANAQTTVANMAAGSHSVQLSGLSGNCSVAGENPRPVTVASAETGEVSFVVTCAATGPTAGSIQVTTTTSGTSIDPDGYTVRLEGGTPHSIGVNGTVTISEVPAGQQSLTLEGVATNCTVDGENPRRLSVTAGSAAQVAFVIVCATPALTWRQMETGTTTTLADVAGSSGTDVFAVGASTILHYDGQRWSRQPASGDLRSVWSNGPTDAFAVGLGGVNGAILHYDGTNWSEMEGINLLPLCVGFVALRRFRGR